MSALSCGELNQKEIVQGCQGNKVATWKKSQTKILVTVSQGQNL